MENRPILPWTRPFRASRPILPWTRPLALTLALAVLSLAGGCSEDHTGTRAELSLVRTLGSADTAGYARATAVRPFVFPADHGPHPDFRTEWWYLTGNLESEAGRRVGYQLTLFRSALAPRPPELASAWSTRQAWMGHFAVTDVRGKRFHAFERFTRGALGLAGARAEPFRAWIEDWTLTGTAGGAAGVFPLRLRASEGDVALELTLGLDKPRVLQGEDGLSRKGSEVGNASFYYSYPRLTTEGSVRLGEDSFSVTGRSWMDREWSTSALGEDQVGWDWFALQLDDGWDLMIYRLRRKDGSAAPTSDGVLVAPDGSRARLTWGEDVEVEITDRWASPVDGTEYPSGWRIRVPDRGWDLSVRPVLDDQELTLAFRYWEGAVDVSGTSPRGSVRGRGYVELTGYVGAPPGS